MCGEQEGYIGRRRRERGFNYQGVEIEGESLVLAQIIASNNMYRVATDK